MVHVDRAEPGLAVPRAPSRQLAATITGDDRFTIRAERHAQEVHRSSDERRTERAESLDVVLGDDTLLGGHDQA